MTEQRTNGLGQTVEYNEDSGRWDKVVSEESSESPSQMESQAEGVTTEEAGTGDPAPESDETMVDEGAATQRRARKE